MPERREVGVGHSRPHEVDDGDTSYRLKAEMRGARFQLVDGFSDMADIYDHLPDQRPSTCGVYALQFLLPAYGVGLGSSSERTEEDYLAYLAGTVLEPDEKAASRTIQEKIDAGILDPQAARREYGAVWYRFPMSESDDPSATGTSPKGTVRATRTASENRVDAIPIPSRLPGGEIQLTDGRWSAILDLVGQPKGSMRVSVIFNYQSDLLLKPDSPAYTFEHLSQPDFSLSAPKDDWGVGHFAALAAIWNHPDGSRWPILFETYKKRGLAGYQPQPSELMREALIRNDGRAGGLLLITLASDASRLSTMIDELGLSSAFWDNGSPDPSGSTSSRS
jgi:hypothetical protein